MYEHLRLIQWMLRMLYIILIFLEITFSNFLRTVWKLTVILHTCKFVDSISLDHTCRLVDCDGEVSQWTTDDLKQYCILKDAARISCLDVTLLYRVITCNVPGSYGYSNDILPAAIWVRNDCYAQFKVCYTTGKHGHFVRYINDSKGDRFIASSFLETHTSVV